MKLIDIEIDDETIAEMEAVTREAQLLEQRVVEFARQAYRVNRRFSNQLTPQLHLIDEATGESIFDCDDWCAVAERCPAYRDLYAAVGALYRHVYAINDGAPEKPAPPWVAEEDESLS